MGNTNHPPADEITAKLGVLKELATHCSKSTGIEMTASAGMVVAAVGLYQLQRFLKTARRRERRLLEDVRAHSFKFNSVMLELYHFYDGLSERSRQYIARMNCLELLPQKPIVDADGRFAPEICPEGRWSEIKAKLEALMEENKALLSRADAAIKGTKIHHTLSIVGAVIGGVIMLGGAVVLAVAFGMAPAAILALEAAVEAAVVMEGCGAAYAALLGGTAACAVGGVVAADFSETLSRLDAVQKEIEKTAYMTSNAEHRRQDLYPRQPKFKGDEEFLQLLRGTDYSRFKAEMQGENAAFWKGEMKEHIEKTQEFRRAVEEYKAVLEPLIGLVRSPAPAEAELDEATVHKVLDNVIGLFKQPPQPSGTVPGSSSGA